MLHSPHRKGVQAQESLLQLPIVVVVDIDALKLEVGVAIILASVVDAVLVTDPLPKLGPYLVATLPALDV